ncbi:MAG: hypothetical protein RR770_04510 [Bacteroidales bacterium]
MITDSIMNLFKEILVIPRESGHEEHIIKYLKEFAKKHKLACKTDDIGNVLIVREASKGKENLPTIVLQSH